MFPFLLFMTEWMCKYTLIWISRGGSLHKAYMEEWEKVDVGEVRAPGGDKSPSSSSTSKNEVATQDFQHTTTRKAHRDIIVMWSVQKVSILLPARHQPESILPPPLVTTSTISRQIVQQNKRGLALVIGIQVLDVEKAGAIESSFCGEMAHHHFTRSHRVPRARFPDESLPCDTLWRARGLSQQRYLLLRHQGLFILPSVQPEHARAV